MFVSAIVDMLTNGFDPSHDQPLKQDGQQTWAALARTIYLRLVENDRRAYEHNYRFKAQDRNWGFHWQVQIPSTESQVIASAYQLLIRYQLAFLVLLGR